MISAPRLLSFTLLWCFCVGLPSEALDSLALTRPFQPGERLTYDISWLNITAGTAVMEVTEGGSRSSATLLTTARSSPMVTKFYPVDNRVESHIDLDRFLPEHMVFHRREGKRKNDFDYTFHHQEGTVTAVKDGTTEVLPIEPATQDLVSCLYLVRSALPMTPGATMAMNVHHDKKNYKLEVRVEQVETVKGPWGALEAARILVVMPFQGIFLNQGNLRVWITTDERRIPLRMKAKVIIGSITADLVDGLKAR
jgi:Protein of unknown function (DUF3108)